MMPRITRMLGRLILLATLTIGISQQASSHAATPFLRSQVSETEVEFHDGSTRLAGTLLLPDSAGDHAAVVVLGGADRSARGPAKNQLARAFAEGGFAALTYDSPGTGRSAGNALLQTRLDRAREGVAAMEFLRSVAGIDPDRVGVCGGSEGAAVALMAAAQDSAAAFSIAISGGFGMSMLDLSRYRIEAMGLRRGLREDDILRAQVLEDILYTLFSGRDLVEMRLVRARTDRWRDEPWQELLDIVESCRDQLSDAQMEQDWTRLQSILRGWMEEPWFAVAVPTRDHLERVLAMDTPTFFEFLARSPLVSGAWYVSPEEFDLLTEVRGPVLAIWGEEDDYLPPHRSAAFLESVLEESGTQDMTLRILPGANHSIWNDRKGAYAEGYPAMLVDWLYVRGFGETHD